MCSLGKWLNSSSKQLMKRFSYQDPSNNTVYMFDGGKFRKFTTYLNLMLPLHQDQQEIFEQIPLKVLPNDMGKSLGSKFRIDPIFSQHSEPMVQSSPISFMQYI